MAIETTRKEGPIEQGSERKHASNLFFDTSMPTMVLNFFITLLLDVNKMLKCIKAFIRPQSLSFYLMLFNGFKEKAED